MSAPTAGAGVSARRSHQREAPLAERKEHNKPTRTVPTARKASDHKRAANNAAKQTDRQHKQTIRHTDTQTNRREDTETASKQAYRETAASKQEQSVARTEVASAVGLDHHHTGVEVDLNRPRQLRAPAGLTAPPHRTEPSRARRDMYTWWAGTNTHRESTPRHTGINTAHAPIHPHARTLQPQAPIPVHRREQRCVRSRAQSTDESRGSGACDRVPDS